jgi:hypothetical protein
LENSHKYADALKVADNDHFNRVWQIMHETYESERHFNDLVTKYRLLASQWLLAAFAGIGFIMTTDPNLDFDKLWLVTGICYISAIGIWQLWRMDLLVYHRLLSACFSAGVDMENHHEFLPGIKNRMLNTVPEKDVTHVLFYFYFLSIAVLSLTGYGIIAYLEIDDLPDALLIGGAILMLALLSVIYFTMRKGSRENWVKEL